MEILGYEIRKNEVMGFIVEDGYGYCEKYAVDAYGEVFTTGKVFRSAFFDCGEYVWTKIDELPEEVVWSRDHYCVGPFDTPKHLVFA